MLTDWRRAVKVWMPVLIGIPAMLLLGYWFEVARFFLFVHHMFWIVSVILLINPVIETLGPSAGPGKKRDRLPPQPSARARQRREAHKTTVSEKAEPDAETPAERLARLQNAKAVLDRNIDKLGGLDKRRGK